MHLFVVGLSHKTAPIELREQLAVSESELPALLEQLNGLPDVSGVFATATCNRFEVYASSRDTDATSRAIVKVISSRAPSKAKQIEDSLYVHSGESAIRHLFRVTSSLDSMVLGEPQILGQVKQAFAVASSAGTLDGSLVRCMNRAFNVAKKVRNETGIARQPVSVPSVSVQLARKVFGQLKGRSVLLIGAGEMCELAARSLLDQRVSTIHVANRSPERAEEMSRRIGGEPHSLAELHTLLAHVDIVLSSTASKDYVLRLEDLQIAWPSRRHRPMLIIDIAVPRDVEPSIGELSNVYLFDIDDLQQAVETNRGERKRASRSAERLVAAQAERFFKGLSADRVTPTIVRLRRALTVMKDEEVARTIARLGELSDADQKQVQKMATTLVNRILHEPSTALKRMAEDGATDETIQIVETLFALENSDEND